MNPDALRERIPAVTELLGPNAVERALGGSVDDRRRILVMLELTALQFGPDESYGCTLDIFMGWLRSKGPDWADCADYDFLAELVQDHVRLGRPIPPPLDQFEIGVHDGIVVRTNRGPRRNKFAFRDTVILEAIDMAISVGDILATRNEASDPTSACDVVAECLELIGQPLPYRAVAEIYQNFKRGMKATH